MLNRTNQARVALLAITAAWFGWPMLAVVLDRGLGVRFLVRAVAAWPVLAFVVAIASVRAAVRLYPAREDASATQTVLPFACLTLCLYGALWFDFELTTDDMGGALTFAGWACVGFVSMLLSPLVWRSQHRALLLAVPTVLVLFVLCGLPLIGRERGRNEERGDRIVAALKAFHDRNNRYPDVLADLIPRDLEEVPHPVRWFWLGSKFHYDAWGFREPGKHPTAYRISYLVHGDMGYGTQWRSQTTEWTHSPSFDGDPQFDHPLPRLRFGFGK